MMLKKIFNTWNKIREEIIKKEDLYYVEHFFDNCNPECFENNTLSFVSKSNLIFKKLERDGVFKQLMFEIPEIQFCKISSPKLEGLIIDKFNKAIIDLIERMLDKDFKFNPVFIHSEPGLGKTFILEKLEELSNKNNISTKYIHTNDFIKQIYDLFNRNESKKIEIFKNNLINKYELILFDDIQFLTGKEKISDIFFQIINNKHINFVFAADVHPEELININKRIVSRLQKGIVLKIDTPSIEAGIKIIEQKLQDLNFSIEKIDKQVIKFISKNFRQDIRKLEGIVKKIVFNSCEKIFDIHDFKNLISNYKFSIENKITVQKIIKIVANFYSLNQNKLTSKQRNKEIVIAKYMAMYLIRELRGDVFEAIAKIFKAKNHTTIVNGIKKFRQLLKTNENLKQELCEIKNKCLEF